MAHVWRISRDGGKKAGQARPELFSLLREAHGFGFPSLFFPPLQLPGEQLGLLQRGADIESALHHPAPPPTPARWLGGNPEIKKWKLTSTGQENRRLPSARVDKHPPRKL